MEESAVCVFLRDTTTAIWLATLQNTTAKYPTPSVSTNCSQGTTKGCSPTCISYGRCRPWMPVAPDVDGEFPASLETCECAPSNAFRMLAHAPAVGAQLLRQVLALLT